jgi:hypothetical protein
MNWSIFSDSDSELKPTILLFTPRARSDLVAYHKITIEEADVNKQMHADCIKWENSDNFHEIIFESYNISKQLEDIHTLL